MKRAAWSRRSRLPTGTKPGTYSVRCDAVAEENPDEDFTEGPSVSFEVAAEEKKKGFPWWIVAVAAVVILGAIAADRARDAGEEKPRSNRFSQNRQMEAHSRASQCSSPWPGKPSKGQMSTA